MKRNGFHIIMKRKLVWFTLGLVMCLIPLAVNAEIVDSGNFIGSSVNWTLDSAGTLTISGKGDWKRSYFDHSSPDSYTSWYSPATYSPSTKKVIIEYGVTNIADGAFSWCESLTEIIIPRSVTKIGRDAFHDCVSITSIDIPNSVISIGPGAFYNCLSLSSFTIPQSVTSIGGGAFNRCNSLKSVNLPDSGITFNDSGVVSSAVTIDDYNPFNNYFGIVYSKIGCDTAKALGSVGCSFRDRETEVDFRYYNNEKLTLKKCNNDPTNLIIPDGVTEIGDSAFADCGSLSNIQIPQSVTSLGRYSFRGCSSLTSIYLPESITSIGEEAFDGCPGIIYAKIGSDTAKTFGMMGSGFRDSETGYDLQYYFSDDGLKDLYFIDCDESLTSISIPNGVTVIAPEAFINRSALTNVIIPNSVQKIEDKAFKNCDSMGSIILPDNIIHIGRSTFSSETILYAKLCSTTANTLWEKGYAFRDIDSKSDFYSDNGNLIWVGCDKSLKELIIPDGVTRLDPFHEYYEEVLGGWEFLDNNICSITIPDSLVDLRIEYYDDEEENPLHWFFKLKEIHITSSHPTYTVANNVLFNKNGDTILFYPKYKTDTSYTIPEKVKTISAGAFSGSSYLKKMILHDNLTIENRAFCSSGITTLEIPQGSSITINDYAFYACNDLQTVIINANLKAISVGTFAGCKSLESIILPLSIKSIDKHAFTSCYNLKDVYYGGTELDRAQIVIGDDNIPLLAATWHYADSDASPSDAPVPTDLIGLYTDPNGTGTYNVDADGNATYTKPNKTTASVTIPDFINGYKVIAIADNAFKGNKKLKIITIGKNIKTIGKNAFNGCTKLKTVKGAKGVITIKDSAFSGCKVLKTAPTFDKLQSIGANAFKSCVKLAKITLAKGVKSIGKNAFNGCKALKTITVKTEKLTNKKVGAGAFKGINKKATFKCPKKQMKNYKTLFVKKGAPKTCKFK